MKRIACLFVSAFFLAGGIAYAQGEMKADESKTKFNFDNIAYVGYFPTGNDEGIVGWNIGLSYNRVKSFNRSYRMNGAQPFSVADYAADMAHGIPEKDLTLVSGKFDPYFDANNYWLSVLGYEAGFFKPNTSGGRYLSFSIWGAGL